MKSFKNIKKIVPLLLVPFFLTGCLNDLFEQPDYTYDGPNVVEFRNLSQTVTEPAAGGAAITVTNPIQLISAAGLADSDIAVAFGVDADNTTAVAGTHYSLNTTSPVTISSGSASANLSLDVLDSPLTAGQSGVLTLVLESGSGYEAGENIKTYTLTILGSD
ncbi:hypothetical protein AB2B38_004335 [Balneola sp. MJW-20]|uniref:hypothetical protein n=1 Tax=Gracilimonas aurantiaca TaxID=3234185 RepID=UPI0034674BE4